MPSWILSQTCISIETTNHLLLWNRCDPAFWANSSDLLSNIGPLTHAPRPITIENHWLRAFSTSGTLPSHFRFWEILFFPVRNVHSFRSFSCCSVTRAIVDFVTPVISASWRWQDLGGWFLIYSSKAVLSASFKSLLGIFVGIYKFKWKNSCTRHKSTHKRSQSKTESHCS
jgi:hypothetical protein